MIGQGVISKPRPSCNSKGVCAYYCPSDTNGGMTKIGRPFKCHKVKVSKCRLTRSNERLRDGFLSFGLES